MVLPGSQWLLSVCPLSWCCDAGVLRSVDPESESSPTIWSEEGKSLNTEEVMVETGMENNVLNATSKMCEPLAKDPKFQQGYIAVTFSTGVYIL
ncbi:palmitoyl-protein thioesterase 1-like [Onychomys torridus]|uniref:palmitoyl-protein thioesterase 1-like n=1 Tax=Onychomys torridus TaxID=38674 RepID=UPI00167F554F|nr:palmitoyl-protein thioesterase 1-like [Onychomys torridus]